MRTISDSCNGVVDCGAAKVDCACDLACDVVVLTSFHGHALATNAICTDACDGVWHEFVRLEKAIQQQQSETLQCIRYCLFVTCGLPGCRAFSLPAAKAVKLPSAVKPSLGHFRAITF